MRFYQSEKIRDEEVAENIHNIVRPTGSKVSTMHDVKDALDLEAKLLLSIKCTKASKEREK